MSDSTSNNIIGDTSKSVNEDFFRTNQESVEKGLEKSFKDLNNSLYTTINSTFSTFSTDYEKRLDHNREVHERAVAALNEDKKKIKKENKKLKQIKKDQQKRIIAQFAQVQEMKQKFKIFSLLYKFKFENKARRNRNEIILTYLYNKRKLLIFNSWRNVANSLLKGKIKLKFNEVYNTHYNKMSGEFDEEMAKLKNVLENLELDIKKEMDERRALSKLYDLSMKKGVEAFLKETNYMINFNSSQVPTPNERSFADLAETTK